MENPGDPDAPRHPSGGPLEFLRILELGSIIAGPFAGHLMADLGAEVIKVESPDVPDAMRVHGGLLYQGRGLAWLTQSRNKKCITLNLRVPEGQEILRRLVKKADILIENFRPGTMEKWNLGWEQLSAINPGLIMTRVSGFGQTGPYRDRAGFGSVGEAIGGIRYLTGYPDRPPVRTGLTLGDSIAGLFAAVASLSALLHRNRTGRGQVVDCAITEAVFALMESILTEYDLLGVVRERTGSVLPRVAPSNVYPTADGKMLLVAAHPDNVFRRLCEVMGRPELTEDPRYATLAARGDRQAEVDGIIAEWTSQHDSHKLWAMLNDAGVAACPIYSIADIVSDEQFNARGMICTMSDAEFGPVKVCNVVPQLSETPGTLKWTGPPRPGWHNREVYGEMLGMSEQEIERLKAAGII